MTRRILVIDDHVAIHRGLKDILADSLPGAEFGYAANAQQALDLVRNAEWELAVLDLSLAGQSGLELIRTLKEHRPRLRILVYTMHSEEHFAVRAVRAGADGYLTKDRPLEEMSKAVGEILAGRRYISPATAAAVARTAGAGASLHDGLSDREYEILRKIAAGKTPTDIARELSLSVKTVSTYRARLLEKLHLRSTADLIRYAVEHRIAE